MFKSTIIHIPHSSRFIPEECRDQFLLNEEQLERELNLMTDGFTDVLFDVGCNRIVYPVSRLVCDPERFRADEDEPMSKVGMGAIYHNCSDGRRLRRSIKEKEQEEILKRYYDVHHSMLTDMVERKLLQYGECLIVDGHSFSDCPLPYEAFQKNDRPDFCIGTDQFHTPKELKDVAIAFLQTKGFSVSENYPYSGTITPLKYYRKEENVHSVMIEVNRKIYLNRNFMPSDGFRQVKSVLRLLIEHISHPK